MDISGMINSMLPTLSYIMNLANRVFTIFCSYLGIDIDQLYEDSQTTTEGSSTEDPTL